jgi:hypothetical protein
LGNHNRRMFRAWAKRSEPWAVWQEFSSKSRATGQPR